MKKQNSVIRILLCALLTFSSLAVIPSGPQPHSIVSAQSNRPIARKFSPDLEDKISKNPSERVSVLIQTSTNPSSGLLSSLSRSGGITLRAFRNVHAMAVELPAAAVDALSRRLDVDYISLDKPTQVTASHLETTTGANLVRSYGTSATGAINGSGIGIAILDSGVYAGHHSFLSSRLAASVDFTGEGRTDDPYGHGTHIASIVAGNAHVASGAYTGIAPAANIINVRVLNSQGQGSTSNAIAGIDWCISNKSAYNIRVLNLSFGVVAVESYQNDALCRAVRRAVDAGMVVCVAAGNAGKNSSGNKIYGAIHSPGIEPSAITVGAANSFGTNYRGDDEVASYSSRGPTRGYYTDAVGIKRYDNLIKPDLIAPGNKIIDARSPNNFLLQQSPSLGVSVSSRTEHMMMYLSGTSMAAPVVAGAAALMLQRNPALTPNLVKALLEYSAQPLAGYTTTDQGAGLVNIEGAVRLAGLVRTDLTGRVVGDSLLTGAAPAQTTTIAGQSFPWSGGIIQKWNFISGNNLVLKYQGIYGTGVLLTEGVILSNGSLLSSGTLLSNGTMLSSGVLISDGTLLSSGTLLAYGTMLASGTLLADWQLYADGTLLSDSLLYSQTSPAAASAMAMTAMNGDQTLCMSPEPDTTTN
ncbi:MAG TPA: S8 family peptidase [Blastocatellia bacterium]|nr:S8 family peptidase [Blastocatellia bacterium]